MYEVGEWWSRRRLPRKPMAQKPWPVQMGSMALLPEHVYSRNQSLAAHPMLHPTAYAHHPSAYTTAHGAFGAHAMAMAHHHPAAQAHAMAYQQAAMYAMHAQHPGLQALAGQPLPARIVGAHPREGWRGAHHVLRRAAALPQPHVGHGEPHALLHEISSQSLHRYRAYHWADKADPAELDAWAQRTAASAERLTAALLALIGNGGGNVSPAVADIAASLTALKAQLPVGAEEGNEPDSLAALRSQLDALAAEVAAKAQQPAPEPEPEP